MTVLQLKKGQTGTIVDIDKSLSGYHRFMELGFMAGEAITLMRKSPLGGPLQVRVGDACFAIRPKEAACLYIDTCL